MSLTLDLDKWVKKSEARIEAVAKESFQRLTNEAQRPVFKGGRMRVDTGFLRNSGQAAIGGLPSGPSINTGARAPEWNGSAAAVVINQLKIGQTIYFGWTANYAIHRENKDGFSRLAIQNWPQIVSRVTTEAKR